MIFDDRQMIAGNHMATVPTGRLVKSMRPVPGRTKTGSWCMGQTKLVIALGSTHTCDTLWRALKEVEAQEKVAHSLVLCQKISWLMPEFIALAQCCSCSCIAWKSILIMVL